jgi:hypothetical protein
MIEQAPNLEKSEAKNYFKKIIEPIILGKTKGLYPENNTFQGWTNLQDNITVFLRSAETEELKQKGLEADKIVQAKIDQLITDKLLII